jgi:hypothetical protein
MPIRRRPYERPLEGGGPGFRRLFTIAVGTALVLGLLAGLVWVAAGLLHVHPVL